MPIKVLMFGWELPPYNSGGLGTACYGLSRALADQNIDLTFVLPQKNQVKAEFMRLVFADLDGFPAAEYSPYLTQYISGNITGLPADFISAVNLYARQAAAIAKKYSFDLVHSHDWLCYPAGVVACDTARKPLVTHVHATEYDRSGGGSVNPVIYALEQNGMDHSRAVIAISQFTKNLITGHYRIPPDKIDVVHNGISRDEINFQEVEDNPLDSLKTAGYKIVLFLGRLTLQKGPDYFIKAAAETLKYCPNTVFIIAGSGDMEAQLITQVSQSGLSDKILFTGFLRDQLREQVYQAADLFVMPSVSEPFGLVALEAVARGTPAIISRQSGVSETLGHVLKVNFWDVAEMTNQIVSVLSYPSLKISLAKNGRQEVKKVSWAAAATKTIEVYKKILNS